jgi:hypothetical protein
MCQRSTAAPGIVVERYDLDLHLSVQGVIYTVLSRLAGRWCGWPRPSASRPLLGYASAWWTTTDSVFVECRSLVGRSTVTSEIHSADHPPVQACDTQNLLGTSLTADFPHGYQVLVGTPNSVEFPYSILEHLTLWSGLLPADLAPPVLPDISQ